MGKRLYSGLKDASGKKIYNGDAIYFNYPDKAEQSGFATIVATVVFENGAFVAKEVNFTGYDWNEASLRPELLYDWIKDEKCYKQY